MAHAFPGALRRSLIATAGVVLLGSVGATCGVVVRGPADARAAAQASAATIAPARWSAQPDAVPERPPRSENVK